MTIYWKAVEQYFTVVLLFFFSISDFGKFISFELGSVSVERVDGPQARMKA